MIKRAASTLLLAVFLWIPAGFAMADESGDEVVVKKGSDGDNVILLQMRLRDLGYYNYKITGYCGDFTIAALKDFQKENGITADGVAGEKSLDKLYSNQAKRKPVKPLNPPKKAKPKNFKYGNLRDWFGYVNGRLRYGTKYKVVDFDTHKTYNIIRVGGHNHADVEPATQADTNAMYITLGRTWDNWQRRALIVYIGGEPIAASLYGEPHGKETVKNNGMNGQVCIHFLNSKTHESNHVDPGHQYQIKRAAGKAN